MIVAVVVGVVRMSEPTPAERLLDLAKAIRYPRTGVIEAMKAFEDWEYERIKLALALERKGPGFKVRAVVEGWDYVRIVKEIH